MAEPFTITALSPLRKVIAARMSEATRTIPHYRVVADIEVDALLKVRQELRNESREGGAKANLSLNDLLIKACAAALMDTPAVNVQWVDDEIHRYHTADISVVIAVEGGLSTPIIRCADTKSIWEISSEVKELAARAAKNALKVQEIVGGSFSISNLGMYDVDRFDAIINPPQCAILAVGAAKPRVVVSSQGEMRVANVMTATLSCDHRAIDGAMGAAFLTALRQRIGRPGDLRHAAAGLNRGGGTPMELS